MRGLLLEICQKKVKGRIKKGKNRRKTSVKGLTVAAGNIRNKWRSRRQKRDLMGVHQNFFFLDKQRRKQKETIV